MQRLRREIRAVKDYQITNVLGSQTVGHAAGLTPKALSKESGRFQSAHR